MNVCVCVIVSVWISRSWRCVSVWERQWCMPAHSLRTLTLISSMWNRTNYPRVCYCQFNRTKKYRAAHVGWRTTEGFHRSDELDNEESEPLQRCFDIRSFVLPVLPLVPLGLKRVCLRLKRVGGDVVCARACVFACLSAPARVCECVWDCVCVCVCRAITALESMLSGVGGVTRLDFWTLCCMDQMVHYTPVWQSNCSLYTTYKHTCMHKHICTSSSTHTPTILLLLSLSEQRVPVQEDWIPTIHRFAR